MGYGGHLVWTAVFRNLHAAERKPILVAATPRVSDLLAGCLYDRARSYEKDPVFQHNPKLRFTTECSKAAAARWLDTVMETGLRRCGLQGAYERVVFWLTERANRRAPCRIVHVDLRLHSYARRQTRRRMIWKTGGHAVDILLRRFRCQAATYTSELYLTTEEQARAEGLLSHHGLTQYLVIDPETKGEWFGQLRAWPFERWQAVVDILLEAGSDPQLVQVGLPQSRRLRGVIDLCGKTTFREAAWVIKRAVLFVGTDGALMHAANAMDAQALILWGGVNLPEFLGYPNKHQIICKYVPCAPCGNLGWCEYDHRCMRDIEVAEVVGAIRRLLQTGAQRERARC